MMLVLTDSDTEEQIDVLESDIDEIETMIEEAKEALEKLEASGIFQDDQRVFNHIEDQANDCLMGYEQRVEDLKSELEQLRGMI
jgi:prefoldin subunit 5